STISPALPWTASHSHARCMQNSCAARVKAFRRGRSASWMRSPTTTAIASRCRPLAEQLPHYDVIVIGGGAAGLMCAMTAGQRGRRVLVIEHANRIGKKILLSGGGRCNFTNINAGPANYLSSNPHFVKSALAR